MEIEVLEESNRKMVFLMKGEGHTLANLLEKELWEDSDVTAAGYFVEHPLICVPRVVLETNGKKSARDVLDEAAKRLKKQAKAFEKAFDGI